MILHQVFIPGATPSSKNSRRALGNAVVASDQTKKWRIATQWAMKLAKAEFMKKVKDLPKPLLIGFHFVRKDKRAYDFINPLQAIQDQMVHEGYGWIPDDNIYEMIPFPMMRKGEWSTVDPKNPGVFIVVATEPLDFYTPNDNYQHG